MNVTINLPPETEAKLREQAVQKGTSFEDYLSGLAKSWVETNGTPAVCAASTLEKTPEQKVAEWRSWVRSHKHVTAIADDSRESIYAGRGE